MILVTFAPHPVPVEESAASPVAAPPLDVPSETTSAPSGRPPGADGRLEGLVEQHFDTVWRSLRRLGVRDSAVDDAAQRVFVIAARKVEEIRSGGEKAFLLGVAVRVASDARRTAKRRREVAIIETDDALMARVAPQPSPEDLLDRKRARELLDRVLDSMPMDLRAAFTMFEIEGMSVQEVATALAIPAGTAASRLRRAREQFQRLLRRFGYGPQGGSRA